jgi:hypothetical protein
MSLHDRYSGRNGYLKRLPAEYYRGQAYVHWTMSVQDRKTGWLVPIFYFYCFHYSCCLTRNGGIRLCFFFQE